MSQRNDADATKPMRSSGGRTLKETKWTAGHVFQYVVRTTGASSA
jgi:hypothetical protein